MSNIDEGLAKHKVGWPFPIEYGQVGHDRADVLVLGGGVAGCWAAISAAREGASVILVDKASVHRGGGGGLGCDDWQFAATNPACKLTPEELAQAVIDNHGGWTNGIGRYIQCRDSYDVLLELERMGVKVRDTEDEFEGAEFRDPETKLLFSYEYENKYHIRVWGTRIKQALERECKLLGVKIFNRLLATSLLTEGGRHGARVTGAVAVNTRTGKFHVFNSKAVVSCLARPERQWIFSTEYTGLWPGDGSPGSVGGGHAMAWSAGAEFTLMEKSQQHNGPLGYPFSGIGSSVYSWFGASIVDANGKKIPWVDRDGNEIQNISARFYPAPGQMFFLDGGGSGSDLNMGATGADLEEPPGIYKFRPPSIIRDLNQRIAHGEFTPPLYADLTDMTELQRKVLFGFAVGQEGKTHIPIYENYSRAGFDPAIDMLQCYEGGGQGLPQWRTIPYGGGGLLTDWEFKTNLPGLYAAGMNIFGVEDHSCAATNGRYAGRNAARFAAAHERAPVDEQQVEIERSRVYRPIHRDRGMEWKEFNAGICRVMQDYCGETKNENVLRLGLKWLQEIREQEMEQVYARNPHELMRYLEATQILTNGELIIQSCLARRASNSFMDFLRLDYPNLNPPEWDKWLGIRQNGNGDVEIEERPINFWGSLEDNYAKYCGGFEREK